MSIMREILEQRRARIHSEGHTLGVQVPERRRVSVVPFGRAPFIICELKRRSPSKGEISTGLDATDQAARYASLGARNLSVLTEEDHFSGSLADLISVKASNPELCVLRKDFLLDVEDVEISYRAGADVVLLIAGALGAEKLEELYRRATELGLACLVEVHSIEEVEKVAPLRPAFTGINARDLSSFSVDPILPLVVRQAIDWETKAVFESGIRAREHALLAAVSGFDGILVGESVVRNPTLIGELIAGLEEGRHAVSSAASGGNGPAAGRAGSTSRAPSSEGAGRNAGAQRNGVGARGNPAFWTALYARKRPGRPLVKVCGLTNGADAHRADELGADLLGFIFAPSKRRAEPAAVAAVGATQALKVGVVVLESSATELPPEVAELLETGGLDAIQLHGDEPPEACASLAYPYFKVLQLAGPEDAARIDRYLCPRVLLDAYSREARGGTGRRIQEEVLRAVGNRPLWLAGGIGPDNVREIIEAYNPELVDSSSSLEAAPGRKDPEKLKQFFAELDAAAARAAGPGGASSLDSDRSASVDARVRR